MDAREVQQVWDSLDRETLNRLVEAGPRPLFATVSGAHLYGFASRDSDVDLRGAFVAPLEEVLGLDRPPAKCCYESLRKTSHVPFNVVYRRNDPLGCHGRRKGPLVGGQRNDRVNGDEPLRPRSLHQLDRSVE